MFKNSRFSFFSDARKSFKHHTRNSAQLNSLVKCGGRTSTNLLRGENKFREGSADIGVSRALELSIAALRHNYNNILKSYYTTTARYLAGNWHKYAETRPTSSSTSKTFSHLWQTCPLQLRSSLSVLVLVTEGPNITHRAREGVRVLFSSHQLSRLNLSSFQRSWEGVSPSRSGMWKYSFQCTFVCTWEGVWSHTVFRWGAFICY